MGPQENARQPGATKPKGAVPRVDDAYRFEAIQAQAAARRRALDCAMGTMLTDVDDDGCWDGVDRSKYEEPRITPVVWVVTTL